MVWVALLGSLSVALAGCGNDESGSSAAATTTSSTSTTGSTSPGTITDTTSSGSTTGSTGSGSTTTPPVTTPPVTVTTRPVTTPPVTVTTPPVTTPPATSTSVTFGWVAPTQNSNGTPLSNLAGYKIHYGTASENYTQVVALSNPSLSRYVLDSLPSGTYFFAITAYNTQGIESALSGEATATLD
jgi:hypothetical protein